MTTIRQKLVVKRYFRWRCRCSFSCHFALDRSNLSFLLRNKIWDHDFVHLLLHYFVHLFCLFIFVCLFLCVSTYMGFECHICESILRYVFVCLFVGLFCFSYLCVCCSRYVTTYFCMFSYLCLFMFAPTLKTTKERNRCVSGALNSRDFGRHLCSYIRLYVLMFVCTCVCMNVVMYVCMY